MCFAVSSATATLAADQQSEYEALQQQENFLKLASTVDKAQQQSAAKKWAAASEKKRQADEDKAEKARAAAEAARNAQSAGSINPTDCNYSSTHNDPSRIDVLVNKKHCIQPLTFAPSDLVSLSTSVPGDSGFQMKREAALAYNQLSTAAKNAGYEIRVTSTYRSYYDQVTTYNYWVGISGKDEADTYSARPGYSEHQTGMAIDIAYGTCALSCFGGTSAYTWFEANAADYGFIQRYYKGYEAITGYDAEEWHYRYVGPAVAKDMRAKGIKTLEQYWGMTGGDYY